MVEFLIIGGALIGALILYGLIRGIITKRKQKDLTYTEAAKEHFRDKARPDPRVDPKAGEVAPAKTLGGQPMYYNEVDHTMGRFVAMFRNESDMADARVVHNNCYRIRYLRDVTYFWFIKASKEEITPCVFRPGIDVINKAPGEEAGVPSEGIVIIKRSMDGQRLAMGNEDRLRSIIQIEKTRSTMLADMLLMVQDKQRLAHMDPSSKEYVDDMVNMIKRTKQIHDAAGGRREEGFVMNPYNQEMYGGEDPSMTGHGGGDEGLWKLG